MSTLIAENRILRTRHADAEWMQQIGRNATAEHSGYVSWTRYVLHDRDAKFCVRFRGILESSGKGATIRV